MENRILNTLIRGFACMLCLSLAGCGGYANEHRANSGVETYGVIDIGIQR